MDDYKVNILPASGQVNARYYLLTSEDTIEEYITDKYGNFKLVKTSGGDGLSAYQIALQNGFVGTEVEWLASLQGTSQTGGTYSHQQAIPELSWTITHNLGFNPNISIVDSVEDQVEGDVTYINLNTLTVDFASPFSGKAYLS